MRIKRKSLPLFRGIDLTIKKLPLLHASARKKGPTVWITAAIHGDEVTGVAVIQIIFKWLEEKPLKRGSLFAFPILNPLGFEMISRHEPIDERDLNRQFPGNKEGSTTERLAEVIFSHIMSTKPDYVIDLHTDSVNSIAYSIIDYSPQIAKKTAFKKSIFLAQTLGFAFALDTQENSGYQMEKCLTGSFIAHNVPAITVELGGPMVVMKEFRKAGSTALWNFLNEIGMFEAKPKTSALQLPSHYYVFKKSVCTQSTGIIEYKVAPGEQIERGQILGKIRNVFGQTIDVIRSPFDGLLFSHEDQSVTFPGQNLFTIGVLENFNF